VGPLQTSAAPWGRTGSPSGGEHLEAEKTPEQELSRSSKANQIFLNIWDFHNRGVQTLLQNKNRLFFLGQKRKNIPQTDPSLCFPAVLAGKTNLQTPCLLHPADVSMSQIYLGEKWLLLKRNTEQKDPGRESLVSNLRAASTYLCPPTPRLRRGLQRPADGESLCYRCAKNREMLILVGTSPGASRSFGSQGGFARHCPKMQS